MDNNTTNIDTMQGYKKDWMNRSPSPASTEGMYSDRKYTGYTATIRELQNIAEKYSPERIYQDFVKIYDATTGHNLNPDTLDLVTKISESYGDDAEKIKYLFTIHYFAMLAEQHLKETKLGKRIKRLAVYQALFDKVDADEVIMSSPRKWWLIDARCNQLGF